MRSTDRTDIYTRVTNEIVAAIEAGAGSWILPWHHDGSAITRPVNAGTGKTYRGSNSAPYRREKKEVSNERSGSLVMTCTHRTNRPCPVTWCNSVSVGACSEGSEATGAAGPNGGMAFCLGGHRQSSVEFGLRNQ